jgi:hypothetical protein
MPASWRGRPAGVRRTRHNVAATCTFGASLGQHGAGGFIYRSTDDTPAPVAMARFAKEIVPAVREAVGKGLTVLTGRRGRSLRRNIASA